MTAFKVIGALVVTVVAMASALFCLTSSAAVRDGDLSERRDAVITVFWSLVTFSLCAMAFTMLTGCSDARALYHACQNGLCR